MCDMWRGFASQTRDIKLQPVANLSRSWKGDSNDLRLAYESIETFEDVEVNRYKYRLVEHGTALEDLSFFQEILTNLYGDWLNKAFQSTPDSL